MAYCLAKSLNAAAWDLMSRIGPKKTAEFAHLCGIKSNIPVVPSIALGSADIQLFEMLRAYTMFPNRGFNTEPIFITRIEDKNGNVIQTFQSESKQVISEVDAYTMYKMMQGVVDFGTGHAMRGTYGINSDMGGKTGTTNDNTDGWFMGYTPQLLAGAWVGCDDPFLQIRKAGQMEVMKWQCLNGHILCKKYMLIKNWALIQKRNFKNLPNLTMILFMQTRIFLPLCKKAKEMILLKTRAMEMQEIMRAPSNVPVESEFNKDQLKDNNSTAGEKKLLARLILPMSLKKIHPDRFQKMRMEKPPTKKPTNRLHCK